MLLLAQVTSVFRSVAMGSNRPRYIFCAKKSVDKKTNKNEQASGNNNEYIT